MKKIKKTYILNVSPDKNNPELIHENESMVSAFQIKAALLLGEGDIESTVVFNHNELTLMQPHVHQEGRQIRRRVSTSFTHHVVSTAF